MIINIELVKKIAEDFYKSYLFPHSPCSSDERNGFRTWNPLVGEDMEGRCSTSSITQNDLRTILNHIPSTILFF